MRHLYILLLTGLLFPFAGCGQPASGNGEQPSAGIESSQLVQSSPPELALNLALGRFSLTCEPGGDEVQVKSGGQVVDALSPPGVRVAYLGLGAYSQGNTKVLVGMLDSAGCTQLYEYGDSDADGITDSASQALVLDTSPNVVHITSIVPRPDGQAWMFDNRCKDVLLADDSNGDGVADTIRPTPFLSSSSEPRLLSALSIESMRDEAYGVRATSALPFAARIRSFVPAAEVVRSALVAVDSDVDGVADSIYVEAPSARSPYIFDRPFDGQDEMRLAGPEVSADSGLVFKVALLDSAGEIDTVLASQAVASSGWVDVSLSSPLSEGDRVAVYFDGREESRSVRVAGRAIPSVMSSDPRRIVVGETATLVLAGTSFDSSMIVTLITEDGSEYTLTTSSVSSTAATVYLPGLAEADVGIASITARLPSQTGGGYSHSLRVCEAPE